jgi:formiminoglutamase
MTAFNPRLWTGRIDAEEGAGPWRWHQAIREWQSNEPGATVLLGFACDEGVRRNQGRIGAAAGPDAIRAALANLPLHAAVSLRDAGNVGDAADGAMLETVQTQFAARVTAVLQADSLPIGLGGGHEMAWASWRGLSAALHAQQPKARIGIINFDAHFDLRGGAQGSSGTPFRQIAEHCEQHARPFDYLCVGVSRFANTRALFERAASLGVGYLLDEHLSTATLPEARAVLDDFLKPLDAVYLTICLDALPAHIAPGVSAPAARGIGLDVIEPLIDLVTASRLVRLADIAELNPRLDLDHRSARVAARLIARVVESTGGGIKRR